MRSVAAAAIFFALLSFLIGGCGLLPDQVDETAKWSAEKLYAEAKEAMNDGAYDKAIKNFEKLEAATPMAAMPSRRRSKSPMLISATGAGIRHRRLRPLHPPAPESPQRRLRLLPEGTGEFRRGSRHPRRDRHAGSDRTRSQGGQGVLRRLQGTGHQVSRAGTPPMPRRA